MNLDGCSCSGFSYTDKYKKAILSFADFILAQDKEIELTNAELQEAVSKLGVSDQSEIRMITPFLAKAGIINDSNCIKNRNGTRTIKFKIDDNFFTKEGKMFIQFLRFEVNSNDLEQSVKNQIEKLMHDFGIIQFKNLMKSDDDIYRDIFQFLKRYGTYDKNEFFMVTHCRKNDCFEKLPVMIELYRSGNIAEIRILNNINSFQYVTKLLQEIGIVEKTIDKRYTFTNLVKEFFDDLDGE